MEIAALVFALTVSILVGSFFLADRLCIRAFRYEIGVDRPMSPGQEYDVFGGEGAYRNRKLQ